MKRTILTLSLLSGAALLMIGAHNKPVEEQTMPVEKHCSGYTVIEAGLGVDCYGDTVKLVRTHGFYELAKNK